MLSTLYISAGETFSNHRVNIFQSFPLAFRMGNPVRGSRGSAEQRGHQVFQPFGRGLPHMQFFFLRFILLFLGQTSWTSRNLPASCADPLASYR